MMAAYIGLGSVLVGVILGLSIGLRVDDQQPLLDTPWSVECYSAGTRIFTGFVAHVWLPAEGRPWRFQGMDAGSGMRVSADCIAHAPTTVPLTRSAR